MKDIRKFLDLWHKMMFILSPSHKRWGCVVFLMSLLGSFAELLGVSIILPFAQAMVEPDKLRQSKYVSAACDTFGITDTRGVIVLLTVCVILIYIVKNVYLIVLAWVRTKYATKVERELSIEMVSSYLRRGYATLRNINYSVILRGCIASVAAIQQIISCFFRILTDGFTLIAIFVFIAVTDFGMAAAMTVVAVVALVLVTAVFRKAMNRAGKAYFDHIGTTTLWLQQLFYGIKEVLVMNRASYFTTRYSDSFRKQQKASVTQTLSQTYPAYFIETLCVMGLMISLCVRIIDMEDTAAYVAQLATLAVAVFRILPSISRISGTFSYFVFQIPSANEVYENMREAAEYDGNRDDADMTIPDRLSVASYPDDTLLFSDELSIEHVSFRYPDGQADVLDDVYLSIHRGEAVAFVGPSGAGKSTLADIILGLFIPQKGHVLMDGIDILANRVMWSRNVGYVPQSVYLLDDTVRHNIAFGYPDEDIDDDTVWKTLEQAQMKEFVEGLPEGLDTIVGERGVKFSGGQAQRLAISRALYTDPQILVLDEATSALDNTTEHAIMDAINMLHGTKTLIIIAHRLSTVRDCDHIYEIRDGHLSEKKYEELPG